MHAGLGIMQEVVGSLLDRMHFDGFTSGSQVVYKVPLLVSGGNVTMLKIITGQTSMGSAGTAITFAESFAYAPHIAFGIEYNTTGADKSAPYAKDNSTSGFTGVCFSTETVDWIAIGIHSEAV